MSNVKVPEEKTEPKIFFDNVVSLLVNCIENRDIRLIADILQDLARRFDIYLKIRPREIALVKLKPMPYDNGVEVYVVNKYGLEITLRIFKTDKYVDSVEVFYSLSLVCG